MKRLLSTYIHPFQLPKTSICVNCVNYIEYKHEHPYDEIYSHFKMGKCARFGEQNLVTGITEHTYADICRKYDTKCGAKGLHFISK